MCFIYVNDLPLFSFGSTCWILDFLFLVHKFSILDLQMNETAYVCELCQKHEKVAGLVQSTENSKPEETMPDSELACISSDTVFLSQLHQGHGKVCIYITGVIFAHFANI